MTITFTHNGKEYTGDISQVQGAGSSAVYHLMINRYYRGRLRLSAFDNRWVFDGEFADVAEAFSIWLIVIDWIKCELRKNEENVFYNLIDDSEGVEDVIT